MVLRNRIQSGVFVFGLSIFMLISGLWHPACASGEASHLTQTIRQEIEQESLDDALSSFKAGNYRKAKITFEILSESSQSPVITSKALFGLASVKFILAQTPDEYADAVSTWNKWSKQSDAALTCEDPRMITPFLENLKLPAKDAAENKGTKIRKGNLRETEQKGVLQAKEKEMQSLRVKLDLREREIRRLRHQLESLEEIHRKYQEKKQEANP